MPDVSLNPTATNPTTGPATALAFDFGTRRIGTAVGNTLTAHAQPLDTLHYQGTLDWAAIDALVAQWQPRVLVVGLPLKKDGTEQAMTQQARDFMAQLVHRFGLPVQPVDERFSSIEAERRLQQQRASGARKQRLQKGDTDAMAAQIILENWLADNGTTL